MCHCNNIDDALDDLLILVDEHDNPLGTATKLRTHQEGLLHRAFSVFLFDGDGRLLLQRRAEGKYHSGGLWTNSCCSHPHAGETLEEAMPRRLKDELGIEECACKEVGSFIYRAEFANNMIEHELDHVFVGKWEGEVTPNPDEASEVAWVPVDELLQRLETDSARFTAWFVPALSVVLGQTSLRTGAYGPPAIGACSCRLH